MATLRKRPFSVPATMDVVRDGSVAATVRAAFFSPVKHRYTAELNDGSQLEAVGQFSDMEWELTSGDRVVGRISREWFKIRDTFGVEVEPGEDSALVVCIAMCVDRLREERRSARSGGLSRDVPFTWPGRRGAGRPAARGSMRHRLPSEGSRCLIRSQR